MNFRKGSLLLLRLQQAQVKVVQVRHSVDAVVHGAVVIAIAVPLVQRTRTALKVKARPKREALTHSVVRKLATPAQHLVLLQLRPAPKGLQAM
jgi:hypothetical protein